MSDDPKPCPSCGLPVEHDPCPEFEESEKQFLRPINPDPATAMARALPKGKK